jgi:rod shape-determining protein MreD
MAANVARQLNPLRWLGGPWILCALGTLLLATPIRVLGLQLPEPVFALAPAFAWAMIRPSILPPFALLLLGLYMDALWDTPAGLWPACLLCAYAPVLVLRNVLAGQSFIIMWVWYAAVCALAFAVGTYLLLLDSGAMPSLIAVGWQFLVTAALFPLAHLLIERYEDADVRFR